MEMGTSPHQPLPPPQLCPHLTTVAVLLRPASDRQAGGRLSCIRAGGGVPVRAPGVPVPSPVLFRQLGERFRKAVASFAEANDIAWVRFGKGEARLEVMAPYLARQASTGRSGVAAIGVAQEFQRVWTAAEARPPPGRRGGRSTRPTGGSPATTSTCGTPASARRSSRSVPTSRLRPRSGSTGTGGSSARPGRLGWPSPHCPTGSPPARTRPPCRRSATGCSRAPSRCSPSGGCTSYPCR